MDEQEGLEQRAHLRERVWREALHGLVRLGLWLGYGLRLGLGLGLG